MTGGLGGKDPLPGAWIRLEKTKKIRISENKKHENIIIPSGESKEF